MTLLGYLMSYIVACFVATLLLARIFVLTKPLPDRRRYDRRKIQRPGHVDRRASYRSNSAFAASIDQRFTPDRKQELYQ